MCIWQDYIRNRTNITLCTKCHKQINKPHFKNRAIFTQNLVANHMNKIKIIFNKPIYVGMPILCISNELMYHFDYNIMKGLNTELCYQDTDSLTYNIKTEDFYEDMKGMVDHFDTSDYLADSNMPRINKKVLGKINDENNGFIMLEFVGLKAKMYATLTEKDVRKKAKRVKKNVAKQSITIEDYKDCLFNKTKKYRKMNNIRRKKHEIYSVIQNKIALNADHDKRYFFPTALTTLPCGDYSIPQKY